MTTPDHDRAGSSGAGSPPSPGLETRLATSRDSLAQAEDGTVATPLDTKLGDVLPAGVVTDPAVAGRSARGRSPAC